MEHVIDSKGVKIEVGARVCIGGVAADAVVTSVSDADGDVDDEGRTVGIPPYVNVRFDSGELDIFPSWWTSAGPLDENAPYACDDVEVAS